ncbi:unnamed protein product [Caenorhabditis auriculariae]|uniref:Uncharacterized protein n=1 Tax=Caenorhabditis auriculariae TaxID=2777116 RepID=A0A8S1HY95_9PELO|nr:unnamed protein product [Caenorhabditis auriculariae]
MGRLQVAEKKFHFGYRVFYNLFRLFPLLYSNLELGLLFTVLTVAAAVGNEIVNYKTGKIPGKFYLYLLERDEGKFWHEFWIASLAYLGLCLLYATLTFFSWCLYLVLRRNLVRSLHKLYYSRNLYYKLNGIDNEGIDNPDQRITQDADKLSKLFATNILPVVLLSPFIITYYSVHTWQTAGGWGVGMVVVYFLIGVVINRILISPLTPWAARVEKSEGDFRYKHVSVRDNAEESAMYRAEKYEKFASEESFAVLFQRLKWFIIWKFPSQFFQYFFDYYGGVLSYAIQFFPIFVFGMYKNLDPGHLSQQISNNAFYFIYLINCFTRLTDLAMNIGELGGYVMRVTELVDHAKEHVYSESNEGFTEVISSLETRTGLSKKSDNLLVVQDLCFGAPTQPQSLIIAGLSFNVPSNKSLLITGPSGVGKTSLLRTIAKLWPHQAGKIDRNFADEEVYFLPQRPYFPVGRLSLRQQLEFPSLEVDTPKIPIDSIIEILKTVQLSHLFAMCGDVNQPVDFEWQDTLSPGEQQRLCFARMILAKPTLAFIDEACSQVDENLEQIMYHVLQNHNINYVSVGHRQSLKRYHDFELNISNSTTSFCEEIRHEHFDQF